MDTRLQKHIDDRRQQRKGETRSRYFDLLGRSVKLTEEWKTLIADMHIHGLDATFEGLERLRAGVDELDDAQKAIQVR